MSDNNDIILNRLRLFLIKDTNEECTNTNPYMYWYWCNFHLLMIKASHLSCSKSSSSLHHHIDFDIVSCDQVILQQVSSSLHRCSGSTHCLDDASNGADSSHNNDPTEDTATLLAGQPRSLSVKAALQQTQDIFQTTRKHTAAVLSSVTDTHWWKKAVSLLQPLPQSTHGDDHSFVRSCDVGKQGCHPFYEGVLVNCCVDKVISCRLTSLCLSFRCRFLVSQCSISYNIGDVFCGLIHIDWCEK